MAEETQTTAPAALPVGPQIPRREAWLDVPEYPGFKLKLWLNYPRRLLDTLSEGDEAAKRDALLRIVLEHNGWRDEEGQPYPLASSPEFYAAIPTELAIVVVLLAVDEVTTVLPKWMAEKRRRSRRG